MTTDPPRAERTLASIDLKEWLLMQAVCDAAKEWAKYQGPDSKLAQKGNQKLAIKALDAAINLRVAVQALEGFKP